MFKVYFIVFLFINSCTAQKPNSNFTKTDYQMSDTLFYPYIDSSHETLNINEYRNKMNSLNQYKEETIETLLLVSEISTIYSVEKYPKNSYFFISKVFYKPSGNIKQKGIMFNRGRFQYGSWYYYDESGHLNKTVDYDSTYKFNFDNLYELLKKNQIPLVKGYEATRGFHTSITKQTSETGEPLWVINHVKHPTLNEIITISGITGKVIKREIMESVEH